MGLRLAKIAAVAAALAGLAGAWPATAATINATASAKVVKPLTLTSLQDLDIGTLVLGSGSWGSETVRLSRTGVLTCPADVTCSGATRVAMYNATGSNGQTAVISAPAVTLVNQSDSSKTLTLVVDSPASVTFTNSGQPGINFPLGGSITVSSSTAEGTYVGTFNISIEYP